MKKMIFRMMNKIIRKKDKIAVESAKRIKNHYYCMAVDRYFHQKQLHTLEKSLSKFKFLVALGMEANPEKTINALIKMIGKSNRFGSVVRRLWP
jgi:hypothetical protein